jgi:hypothetical protein
LSDADTLDVATNAAMQKIAASSTRAVVRTNEMKNDVILLLFTFLQNHPNKNAH